MRTVMRAATVVAAVGLARIARAEEGFDAARWLARYEAAFAAEDLEALGRLYHPDVTIYEGGGVNRGWADYRDHHLGPELREMENVRLSHTGVQVQALGAAAAYVIAEYRLQARLKGEEVDARGLETLVMVKSAEGWRIRHSHTSSRRRPPASPRPSPAP